MLLSQTKYDEDDTEGGQANAASNDSDECAQAYRHSVLISSHELDERDVVYVGIEIVTSRQLSELRQFHGPQKIQSTRTQFNDTFNVCSIATTKTARCKYGLEVKGFREAEQGISP